MSAQLIGSKDSEAKKSSDDKQHCPALQKQLRKTKLCLHHLQGGCNFGDKCSFAHSRTELQSTPDLRKTQFCKAFLEGRCQDMNCDFAHADADLRSNIHFFKKALCVWHEKGKCRHGSHCRFSHGMRELRLKGAVGLDALGAEAKLHEAQGHAPQRENNESSNNGEKSAGSSCSSLSHRSFASTASGSLGRKSGRETASDSECDSSRSGSYAIDPSAEPMKVLQVDSLSQVGIKNSTPNIPLQQARSVPSMTTQSGPANTLTHSYSRPSQRELDVLRESVATSMTTHSGLANTPAYQYGRPLQHELDILQEILAVLTMRCLRLQERGNMGDDGPPGVFRKKDGHVLPQDGRQRGHLVHAPQVPSHVARGYPN